MTTTLAGDISIAGDADVADVLRAAGISITGTLATKVDDPLSADSLVSQSGSLTILEAGDAAVVAAAAEYIESHVGNSGTAPVHFYDVGDFNAGTRVGINCTFTDEVSAIFTVRNYAMTTTIGFDGQDAVPVTPDCEYDYGMLSTNAVCSFGSILSTGWAAHQGNLRDAVSLPLQALTGTNPPIYTQIPGTAFAAWTFPPGVATGCVSILDEPCWIQRSQSPGIGDLYIVYSTTAGSPQPIALNMEWMAVRPGDTPGPGLNTTTMLPPSGVPNDIRIAKINGGSLGTNTPPLAMSFYFERPAAVDSNTDDLRVWDIFLVYAKHGWGAPEF